MVHNSIDYTLSAKIDAHSLKVALFKKISQKPWNFISAHEVLLDPLAEVLSGG